MAPPPDGYDDTLPATAAPTPYFVVAQFHYVLYGTIVFASSQIRPSRTRISTGPLRVSERPSKWSPQISTVPGSATMATGALRCYSQARAAATRAWVPVSRVGWMTGAKVAEWLTGMSWAIRPACSAVR